MGAPVTYPDGSELTSSALTIAQINTIMQPLVMSMLGLTADPASAAVRIAWPAQGAPFQQATDDVCYLECVPVDDQYNKIRDRANESFDSTHLLENWSYTRAWKIHACLYGPNSTDKARQIRSALYQDYFTNALSLVNLFPVSDFEEPRRAPENIQGQWFERVDFNFEMYEFVTETIQRQTISSAEVLVSNSDGQIADINVQVS